ncbi:unnamed protein product [Eruca vesicaria subsp. sativa]|uniref:Secreted protein n=1 Tax=Eruca vesicaria subsp. sativa TaxID=29727 RepID=A0ABC8M0Q5_ERUVS|nr:unnamed protein product [Eruca vesicaria subsp. sativa]
MLSMFTVSGCLWFCYDVSVFHKLRFGNGCIAGGVKNKANTPRHEQLVTEGFKTTCDTREHSVREENKKKRNFASSNTICLKFQTITISLKLKYHFSQAQISFISSSNTISAKFKYISLNYCI